MKEKVFEKHSFGVAAMEIFAFAESIACKLGANEVLCSHVFAAIVVNAPEVLHKLLGRELTKLPEKFNLKKLNKGYRQVSKGGKIDMDFSAEFGSFFLDSTPGAPLQMVKGYFPDREFGVAEIAFALLIEPTEEISDILIENGVPNDAMLLESLLRENYLNNAQSFSPIPPQRRLATAVAMGEKFEQFMTQNLCGQGKAIQELAALFTYFWYGGNHGKPLTVLLLSKASGGRSYFSEVMQHAFVELGLQTKVETPLDLSGFLHESSCEADLLGDSKSFRNARCGKLHEMTRINRRGMLVFEDILSGSRNAKGVLRSFAENLAYDKFHEEVLLIPFNILVFTMKVSDDQYRFLIEKGGKGLDAKMLNELFFSTSSNSDKKNWNDSDERSVAESAGLWQSAGKIVLLEQLNSSELANLAENELQLVKTRLKNDYRISFLCNDLNRLIQMFLLSVPHEIGPGELRNIIDENLKGLWRTIYRNYGLENLEIFCDPLPEYPHAPARRIIRGDYLAFTRKEKVEGRTLRVLFENIHYAQQERIDCGDYRIERPRGMNFDEIIGLDEVRDELLDSLDYITNRDAYLGEGVPPPPVNFILHGPPGTGKTSLAVALANYADIPVFFASSSIFSEAKKISDMFRKAKEMAPAIVVLEEFNSIGDSSLAWKRDSINELLAILNGVQEESKLMVLASTNHLEQIEEALLRSGRFGRQIKIDFPTAEVRENYIRKFEKKFEFTLDDNARKKFVADTENICIADIKGVLEFTLRHSIRTKKHLNSERLTDALQKFKKLKTRTGIGFCGGLEK